MQKSSLSGLVPVHADCGKAQTFQPAAVVYELEYHVIVSPADIAMF